MFLDEEFKSIGSFGDVEQFWGGGNQPARGNEKRLRQTAGRLKIETLRADELSAFLADANSSLLIIGHAGNFPGHLMALMTDFLERGGNMIWLGGRPFDREWLKSSPG